MKIDFGPADLIRRLQRAGGTVRTEIQAAVRDISTVVMQAIIERAPANTGTLRKSIRRDLFPTKAHIYPTVKYGVYVHEGTRPHGIPPEEIAPGGSLHRWATRKGINPYAVARSIARKGTKANPFMKEVGDEYQAKATDMFRTALKRSAEKIAR